MNLVVGMYIYRTRQSRCYLYLGKCPCTKLRPFRLAPSCHSRGEYLKRQSNETRSRLQTKSTATVRLSSHLVHKLFTTFSLARFPRSLNLSVCAFSFPAVTHCQACRGEKASRLKPSHHLLSYCFHHPPFDSSKSSHLVITALRSAFDPIFFCFRHHANLQAMFLGYSFVGCSTHSRVTVGGWKYPLSSGTVPPRRNQELLGLCQDLELVGN
jgi:hypothetical protein